MEVAHESAGYDGRLSDLVLKVKDTIRRRWMMMVLVAAVITALGVAAAFYMTPKYQSTVRIQIDPSRNPLSNSSPSDAAQTLTPEAIDTEVSLISSQDVVAEVVRRLQLVRDPNFAPALQQPAGAPPMSDQQKQDAIVAAIKANLVVAREKLTYILAVSYTSTDAVDSARIANAIADAYIDTKVGSKANNAEKQSQWFQQRLNQLGAEVNSAASRAAQYRAQAGIVQDSNGNTIGSIVDQQIAPLSQSLAQAQSDAAEARAKVIAANAQINSGNLDAVSEVLGSPVISDLRRQRAEVQRSVQEVQARYGDKHPESIRVHGQLDALDRQISDEARRVVGSLQATARAADARVASLRQSMGGLESEQSANTRAAVLADSLQREAATKRAAYDRMSQMSLTATEGAKNVISQAEIVERAQVLLKPTSPNRPLLIAAALIVGLAAGAGVIAIQEIMVTGMRTVEEVQTQLGIPVLAAIPKLPKSAQPADMLLDRPTSLYAESLRIARAAILGVRSGKPIKVIAITSALPSEGKTTTALAFARTLAISNARTLLIECDVRRAQMRFLVRTVPTGPGLVEVLHGEAKVEDAITAGDLPNLDHLLVKGPYFSSEDLFGGGGMSQLIDSVRSRYDQIVLDLPPLVGLADGRFLAVLADATVLIIKWDSTPADAASSALEWLKTDGANPVGAVFSMVDSNAEAIGGLYYSKKYSAYYQAA